MSSGAISLIVDITEPLDPFVRHMAKLGYELAGDEGGGDRIVHWRGGSPPTAIAFVRPAGVEDTGWLTFVGPAALERATDFVDVVQLLPAEMMHRLARGAGTEDQRVIALRVLGAELSASSPWTATLEATLRRAIAAGDPGARREAAACALRVDVARGRALVVEAAAKESDDEVRTLFEGSLAEIAERARLAQVEGIDSVDDTARLAIPFAVAESVEQTLARIPDAFPRDAVRPSHDSSLEQAELRAMDGEDARVVIVTRPDARVGCAYFLGAAGARLASDVAGAFRFYPLELASRVARGGEVPARRARGLWAVAFAASSRIVPGASGVEEARALLDRSAKDEDATVRREASRALELLA